MAKMKTILKGIPSGIDAAIAVLSPGWARRRQAARMRYEFSRRALSTYIGADKGRLLSDWPSTRKSANAADIPDTLTLIARTRALVRDYWAARSIVRAYVRTAIGGVGITAQPDARDPKSGEALEDFNGSIAELYRYRSEHPEFCDLEGRKNLAAIQRMGVSELITVGQSFIVPVYERKKDAVNLRLQLIETEQLDTSKTKNKATGYEIQGGIEIDSHSRPVAYHIYTEEHPLDSYKAKSQRVEASQVWHLAQEDRPRQVYGVTPLSAMMRDMWNLQMYDQYEVVRARFAACIGVILKETTPDSSLNTFGVKGATGEATQDAYGNTRIDWAPGMAYQTDADPTIFAPNVPSGQYQGFTKQQVKQIGAGAGVDYNQILRDYTEGTYSGQRQGLLELWAETESIQDLIKTQWLQPDYELFVTLAILEGKVKAPGFFTDPVRRAAYLAVVWTPKARAWIDPAKQALALKTMLDIGAITHRDINNERGIWWKKTFRQRAEEKAYAEKVGAPYYEPEKKQAPSESRAQGEGPGGEDRIIQSIVNEALL